LPQKINFSRYMKQQPGAAEKKHKLKEHWCSQRSLWQGRSFAMVVQLLRIFYVSQVSYVTYVRYCIVSHSRYCMCIFSGGRDTIGLHWSSLKADTIQTHMVVKVRLHLARTAIIELLGDK
jgi:hypothetical protein